MRYQVANGSCPIWSMILGIILLAETSAIVTIIGVVLILGGGVITQLQVAPPKTSEIKTKTVNFGQGAAAAILQQPLSFFALRKIAAMTWAVPGACLEDSISVRSPNKDSAWLWASTGCPQPQRR